ncbi:5-formyltetrahydrofolate cyclo-ligase [Mycobacterium bohemicum DSM 44277]|uniref:5-formyltetrahydrofolate cyclo-ligase n=2 Tax=Mycobacterium bohemicum TaxID=56425 RepID=A0A1X1R361_MYCBE|nr:5-formyltetrahydrofolate cyclo-ligase [Mycobacterium bohemicum]MCV6969930.1 5-formyltetrahydrofolate cyclo-ligase [Mycobacterium bohemicum]ORU98570.1 5-formyltetrahydrofolate cyclo-ligase [Mycobacterium bohemicum]CPR08554.1 5-formyltetrahydrofolate cyclo-ligase [Mycobacterium bohemicum DSM 44277]
MPTASKAALREQLLAGRRGVDDEVRAAEARLLGRQLEQVVPRGATVCAYVPVGTEPGSIDMLDTLLRRSARVLLPIARTAADQTPLPLSWGEYLPGALMRGRWGLLEPPEPHLPPSALGEAVLVLVPSLAVDRRGVRLGRGAGFYDRSLGERNARARLVAVVRDDEVLDELPAEPHDVRMTHAITPHGGLIALFCGGRAGECDTSRGGSST